MVPGVGDAVDADQLARVLGPAAGDAADDSEAPAQLGQGGAGAVGHSHLLGILRDRSQGAVDVAEDRGRRGILEQRRDEGAEVLVCGCRDRKGLSFGL
jgi:hypothetical protein